MRALPFLLLALSLAACSAAAPAGVPAPSTTAAEFPGLSFIREDELRADLFALAGDHMRGREAGTIDEMRASMWVAAAARAAGLEPAGLEGSYFQWFPLRRLRPSETSRIIIGDDALRVWYDVALMNTRSAAAAGPVLWLGSATAADSAQYDVRDRIVAVNARSGQPAAPDLLAARYFINRTVNAAASIWIRRGAAAVLVVADAPLEELFEHAASNAMRGSFALELGQPLNVSTSAPTLLLRRRFGAALELSDTRAEVNVAVDHFHHPAVNVIGLVPGTDPALRGQYVLFSAHQDHDGVRAAVRGDSIFNGADDNATVSVAILAIARAWVRNPGRRSALFVWHGAEEKGLHGSNWHVRFPVVPRDSIVAVLNGDMIGRNHPDSASLLGSIPPHRNSTALVAMAHDANRRVTGFAIDSTWDRPTHPEGWYFRSDHLPYARANIPALFFTTLLHDDYHTPFDNPDRINIAKLARMTRWMYATGWLAANADRPPGLDPGFRLER